MTIGPLPDNSRSGLEIRLDDACIVFALRQERRPFCREFPPQQRFPGAPCWAKFCGPAWLPVLAVETGVGPAASEQSLAWLLNKPQFNQVPYRPKLVLAAGFCGALQEGLRTGDLVLATEVADAASGAIWQTTWPAELPGGTWDPPLRRGPVVTAPQLAATAEKKQALGRDFDALAVDMESATIAPLCHQAGVPFGCLRVVLDELETPLSPRLVSLLSAGRVSPWRLSAGVLAQPWLVAELWGLAKRSRFAGRQLGRALGELLTLTLPWLKD